MADPLSLNHLWLFMTDRCNLRCGYCFFRHKTGTRVMAPKVFRAAMAFARDQGEVIFSGGEPLAAWPALTGMVSVVRRRHPQRYVSVQTNATLINARRAAFFVRRKVNVEVGIDGDEKTTLANRPGSGVRYADIVRGVKVVLSSGGTHTATMTVHPSGAGKLGENVKILAGMGLRSIEVHPAFLEAWDERSASVFLEQYRRATAWDLKQGAAAIIGRGYSSPARGAWDMVVLPDGKVLPSWVFLSFPENVRARFCVMDLSEGGPGALSPGEDYFSALKGFLRLRPGMPSYRELSNFNAELAVRSPGGKAWAPRVRMYTELCERVEAIDRKVQRRLA